MTLKPRTPDPGLALACAQLTATATSMGTSTAVAVVVAKSGYGSWAIAAILLIGALPSLVLAPLAAPLLDGRRLGRLVMTAGLAEAIALALTAIHPNVGLLIAMAGVIAVVSTLSAPALLTLAQRSSEHTTARSFARMDTARIAGMFLGPAIGGALVQWSSISVVLLVDAACAITLALVAAWVPEAIEQGMSKPASWWTKVREAPALLWSDVRVRGAMMGLCAAIVFTSVYSVAEALYALHTLSLPPLGYAVLGQCFIAGRLAGSRVAARITSDQAPRILVYAGLAMGVALAIPGLVPNPWLAGIFFAVAGIANAVQVAAIRLVIVDAVPEATQPRALSTMGSVNTAAMLCGFMLGAPVVAALSPPSGLILAGVGTALMVLAGAAVTRLLGRTSTSPDALTNLAGGRY
ncbi:putative drug resistance transporter [Gordonia effusa NBRC 100432]|uniref:Putative drug resistance transporter n=1 Tax=Gordonia effusa NBRC 100432 TaxID=1077974 RepID=H0R4T0_9ACTN|nr:MFS transporter [Gordonia effusa]GAB20081.1 putative drug resistance transporter [Gordonia effusa NBRC 100432]